MTEYEPTAASLSGHTVPDWYHDAKLGIFIHWGIYSVPAWAPDPGEGNDYAEWYPHEMYVEETPTHEHHREQYGDREYIDFAEDWHAENWDPESWAAFFDDVGAGYVVLTGEHHDGFPLWPSHYTEYDANSVGPERDLVGELCAAARDRGLRFAASYHANLNYYQPGFEGPFGHPDYHGGEPFEDTEPGPEYIEFMNAKHRELIRRYRPDLLWFDTPQADAETLHANELIADYYNRAEEWGKEVAVNDRASTDHDAFAGHEQGDADRPGGDFATPEYTSFEEIKPFKWETCRGIGHSFGYNAREGPGDHLSTEELVALFVDVVSKNGNLLINVGPRADGTIPDLQREPLAGLGAWLDASGPAIYGTRPWAVAESDNGAVRYTHRDGDLYAIALSWPDDLALELGEHADVDAVGPVALLTAGDAVALDATFEAGALTVDLPEAPPDHPGYAYAVRVAGVPNPRR